MAFQTKNFLSIVSSMINLVRTRTSLLNDFNVGSVNRTMLEAPAQEIDELYQQMVAGLVQAIPVATYRSFDFSKLQATAAGGLVRVTIAPQTAVVLIPAGTTLTQTATASTYTVTTDTTIAIGGSYADVPVVCAVAGSAGNLGASVAFSFVSSSPAGFVSATNLIAFINGSDLETDAQQKSRFNEYVRTLARGTVDALEFASLNLAFLTDVNGNVTERVVFVSVHEPYLTDNTQPPAWVQVFVHNGTGGTSSALVAQVVQILNGYTDATGMRVPGYKAAGTHLDVAAATEVPIGLAGTVLAQAGYTSSVLAASAISAVATYIGGLPIGGTYRISEAIDVVMNITGVLDFTPTGSPANVVATYLQKPMPGTLAIVGG